MLGSVSLIYNEDLLNGFIVDYRSAKRVIVLIPDLAADFTFSPPPLSQTNSLPVLLIFDENTPLTAELRQVLGNDLSDFGRVTALETIHKTASLSYLAIEAMQLINRLLTASGVFLVLSVVLLLRSYMRRVVEFPYSQKVHRKIGGAVVLTVLIALVLYWILPYTSIGLHTYMNYGDRIYVFYEYETILISTTAAFVVMILATYAWYLRKKRRELV